MADRSELIVELATNFIEFMRELEPTWRRAFLRFRFEPHQYGSNASYEHAGGVNLINAIAHSDFFEDAKDKGARLFALLGKDHGVFLLVVDAAFDYKVMFDYDDLDRWRITKLDGRTGVPDGFD